MLGGGGGTGCKTDHGEKRVGHGEVTRYKSRVIPFCLALFVHPLAAFGKAVGHMVSNLGPTSVR